MDRLMTIGRLASQGGVSPDTIRYYERLGLLPAPARTAAGYRQYPEAVLTRLRLVRNAQRFGFTLREIVSFLRVRDAGGKPCQTVLHAAEGKLAAVDAEIRELIATRDRMRATLRTWKTQLAQTPGDRPARLLERLIADDAADPHARPVRPRLRARQPR